MDSDSNSDTDTDSEKDDENERKKQPVPFSHKFSKADPLALRLLERLLAFDPRDRASTKDELSDPYFSGLSNSEREPSTQPISKLEFDFERKKLTNDDVRELIYRERLEEYKHGGDQLSFMYPRLASIFIEHILFKQ
uniref:Protein kinase domain-containing protein n=1 Tax=Brassica oleracea var. oleracea TaxID=109376 RepID=A0A0D3E4L5_BRAOL